MSAVLLISEGRRLQRDSSLLVKGGKDSSVVARWYEPDYDIIEETEERLWLAVKVSSLPRFSETDDRVLLVITSEHDYQTGRVEIVDDFPDGDYTELTQEKHESIPPIGVVCSLGNNDVAEWLKSEGQDRTLRDGYGAKDHPTCIYDDIWFKEYPFYKPEGRYAMIDGWHLPIDFDWHELLDSTLLIQTLEDSEPWVEVFMDKKGAYKVIQRHT